jgi:hypothetical protein
VAEPTKPCPLLKIRKIHVIHVSSQWLSLLSVPSSKDPQIHVGSQWLSLLSVPSSKDPRDPREQSVAKPTERALF